MYYYFSSAYPAAIKFNGIYYGVISETVKSCNFETPLPLVEVCPLCAEERQINFFPDHDFLTAPPNGILITDLKGGYLIKFLKNSKVGDFKVISQKNFNDLLVTVFIENGLKISVETPSGFFADSPDCLADDAEIDRFSLNGRNFCLVLLKGETPTAVVYALDGEIRKVFSRTVTDYSVDGGFYTTEKFSDIAKHSVKSEWEFADLGFRQKNVAIERDGDFDVSSLNAKILPYAFLEELLVGGSAKDYLSENLKDNADRLKEYLGDYIGIMPPPIFRRIDEIGLIFLDGKNKYHVDYCTFTVTDGKISNIKKSDS